MLALKKKSGFFSVLLPEKANFLSGLVVLPLLLKQLSVSRLPS